LFDIKVMAHLQVCCHCHFNITLSWAQFLTQDDQVQITEEFKWKVDSYCSTVQDLQNFLRQMHKNFVTSSLKILRFSIINIVFELDIIKGWCWLLKKIISYLLSITNCFIKSFISYLNFTNFLSEVLWI